MRRRQLHVDVLRSLASARLLPHRLRPVILSRTGVQLNEQVHILSGSQFVGSGVVTLGAGVFVNANCYIDAQADVTVGENVSIGDHVRLLTSTHGEGTAAKRAGPLTGRAITIGAGTWIGSGVTVLPGVSVGAGCVIAAGSVVISDCEPNSLYAGIPARMKRRLN